MTSRSNWLKLARMFSVRRPIDVRVSKLCVVLTNPTPCRSSDAMKPVKSVNEREIRSILYAATTSTLPASMSATRRWKAGRSVLPPEKPWSS
jgi:hypothetical protein